MPKPYIRRSTVITPFAADESARGKGMRVVMPNKDFLPTKDALLLQWSSTFSTGITAAPTTYGLVAAQATAYAALDADFATKLATSSEPSTRTRGTISAKNDSRTLLKAGARDLARIINAHPGITNQQRIDLGLNPRKSEASPINPPETPPVLEVVGAIGRTLKLKLKELGSDRRGKPDGVDGATIFSFIGGNPPADITQWVWQGSTTRTVVDVEFAPSTAAGAQVWLCAFWFNGRSQSGPACQPVSAYLAGGVSGSAQQEAA